MATSITYGVVRGGSGSSGDALAYNGAFWLPAAQLPTGSPGTAQQAWTEGQTIQISVPTSGGGGGGSTLTASFVQPAVNATVSPVAVAEGSAFQQGYAVTVLSGGIVNFYTVTAVAGDDLTLANVGVSNAASGTTIASGSIITVASVNAAIGPTAPATGQALVLQSSGSYAPTGVPQRLVADSYALATDPDDTNCINRMFAVAYALQVAAYAASIMTFLPRAYSASGSLQCVGTSGANFSPFIEGGSTTQNGLGTEINASGSFALGGGSGLAAWTPLLLVQWCQSGRIEKINLNGNARTLAAAQQKAYSSGVVWDACVFANNVVFTARQTSHAYTKGQAVLSDVAVQGLPDNTHLYIATTSGTTGSGAVVWPTTAGGTVVDGGVTWQEFGPSHASFLQGDTVAATGGINQAADTRWNDCVFGGPGVGWRSLLTSSNTKDFILSHCFFINCAAIGCDMVNSAGFVALTAGTEFSANGFDIRIGDGISAELGQGWSSEGSSGWVIGDIGGLGNTQLRVGPGYWQGGTLGGTGAPCMTFGGRLDMAGVYIADSNVANAHPYLFFGNVNGCVTSHNNIFVVAPSYTGPYFAPFYDTGGNGLLPGNPSYYPGYGVISVAVSSANDSMFDGSANHPLPNVSGTAISSARAQLSALGANSSNVTWTTYGVGTKGTAKCSVSAALMQSLAVAQSTPDSCVVIIAVPWNRVAIEKFDFAVTAQFTGLAGGVTLTMSGGNAVPAASSLSATPAVYLAATTLLGSAPGPLVVGVGASIGTWVWGPASGVPSNPDTWYLTATITCSAALSGLTGGSVDVYLNIDNRSGL